MTGPRIEWVACVKCGDKAKARRLCPKHYKAWLRKKWKAEGKKEVRKKYLRSKKKPVILFTGKEVLEMVARNREKKEGMQNAHP